MTKQTLFLTAIFLLTSLACGGSEGAIGSLGVAPENVRIEGLPQYVCPTATPRPTHTAQATDVQAPIYATGVYLTLTAQPGCMWDGVQCATFTPAPGWVHTPGGYTPAPTSTPRPTHTPWPSPTPYISQHVYFFDDDVYTDRVSPLALRLRVGDVQIFEAENDQQQLVSYEVQVENRGVVPYVLMAPAQIYVARVGDLEGRWPASSEAARGAGITLAAPAKDGTTIAAFETIRFKLVAMTPVGEVDAIAWILDPLANGFDGQIAGGNVAYWVAGSHPDCRGNVEGPFTPPPNLTPNPTRTQTPTPSGCRGLACATTMP